VTAQPRTYRVGTRRLRVTPVFNAYWRFARSRHDVYERRILGADLPWTDDPVLSMYRFTNAFRAADRVSQELLHAQRNGSSDPYEVLFRTLLFRFFNKSQTYQFLTELLGRAPSWASFQMAAYDEALGGRLGSGQRLYSAAYIIPSPPFAFARKHRNHLALLEHVMAGDMAGALVRARTLKELYHLLVQLPGLGPFLAFQLAIDLGYATPWAVDESEYVVAGPGAASGIRKCFSDTGGLSSADLIRWMTDTQNQHFTTRGLAPVTLFGRPLQLIDCQNLFCETDKYARVMHPTVRGVGNRLRIKQRYLPGAELALPSFPAHWKLLVPGTTVGGQPAGLALAALQSQVLSAAG
jgi:hypothetical protein